MMYNYKALITKVVDGDTVDVRVFLGFNVDLELRLRLNGIDTKEIRSPIYSDRVQAQNAKAFLEGLVHGEYVTINTYKSDKYGRWLADIYLGDLLVNKQMIDEGFAVPYDGGKR